MLTFTVNKTYEVWTPEDVEIGDTDDRGFVYENETMDFYELIRELREHSELSESPVTSSRCWATGSYENPYTGVQTNNSIHINTINGHEPTVHQLKRIYKAARLIK